jgi:hypothetical protein
MPIREEPGDKPAPPEPEAEGSETVSLVDLFDQIDRKAFRRALEQRDSTYPDPSNRYVTNR